MPANIIKIVVMLMVGVGSLSVLKVAADTNVPKHNWMEQLGDLIADRPITQLVIPGSHDAGAVSIYPCEGAICGTAVNQDGDITDQLNHGSRYLDLRFSWNCALQDYGTYHNKWPFAYPMRDILLDEIPDFVAANQKELIILNIGMSHKYREAEPEICEDLNSDEPTKAAYKERFESVCRSFNAQSANEFLRPSRVLGSPYIEIPVASGSSLRIDQLTDESAATRAAMMLWDPDSNAISVARSEHSQSKAGLLAGTATMQDIWDLNGPQIIAMWPECAEHLADSGIENNLGHWKNSSTSSEGAQGQRSGPPRTDGVFISTDYSKYYPNWCNNNDNRMWNLVEKAITGRVVQATRLAGNRESFAGEAFGLYNTSLATTFIDKNFACIDTPRAGFDDQEDVALKLENRYYGNDGFDPRALRARVNIIEGDFIVADGHGNTHKDSVIPAVAILTNEWAGDPDKIDIQLDVTGSGSNAVVNLVCSGTFVTTGQLMQVPEPYARIEGQDPLIWHELLQPLQDVNSKTLSWLAHPQFRVMDPVMAEEEVTGRWRAQIHVASETAMPGAPPSDISDWFPGREFSSAPTFLFSGKRTETFIGTCTDSFGFTVRDTVSVDLPDQEDPTIELRARAFYRPFQIEYTYSSKTWTKFDVSVQPICIDDSRFDYDATCPPQIVYNDTKKHTVPTFTFTDVAGTSVSADFGEVWIDKVKPEVSTSLTNSNGIYIAGVWSNSDVTVTTTCTDDDSRISSCPNAKTFSEGENQSYGAIAFDNAGNVTQVSVPNIYVDTTAPTISASAKTSDNNSYQAGGWVNQSVSVDFQCDDDLSRIKNGGCPSTKTIASEGDMQSVTGTTHDNAGNSNSTTFSPIRIDRTKPELLTSAKTSDGNTYSFGDWTNQSVTVEFACNDSLSGVYDCPSSMNLTNEGANQTAGGTAYDHAGNSASTSVQVSIDLKPPTIEASAKTIDGNAYEPGTWVNQPIEVSFVCDDELSTFDSSACPASVTIDVEGKEQSVSGTVSDRAGNSTSTNAQPLNIDLTAPVVTYTPAAASYSLLDQVVIDCTPSDALSYVESDTCASVDAPSIDFDMGEHTLTASATDAAGNIGHGAMSFLITASHADLCTKVIERMSGYPDTAEDLCDTLEKAADYEYDNKDEKHDNRMRDFQEDVQSALEDGELSNDDAELFTRIAQYMIDLFTPDLSAEGRVHGSGHWARATDDGKVDFSFEAKFDDGELRGKLKMKDNDKDTDYNVIIDGDRITSLTTGDGVSCGGVTLDGVNSFALTAQGQFEQDDSEVDAEFFACGIDNGKGDHEPADYFYIACAQGCDYVSSYRVAAGEIAGGNVHLHDAIISGGNASAAMADKSGSARLNNTATANSKNFSKQKSGRTAYGSSGPGEVDVISLDPILQDTALAGSQLLLLAIVEHTDGLAISKPVVLSWSTAAGMAGETPAVTDAVGIATFVVSVPEDDVDFVVRSGGIESNGVRITSVSEPAL